MVLDVSKDGKHVTTLRPSRNNYPLNSAEPGPIARYFEGEATSEVALDAGPLTRPLVERLRPTPTALKRAIAGGGRAAADRDQPRGAGDRDHRDRRVVSRARNPTARMLFIVNPLVTWIWIGGDHRAARRADCAVAGAGSTALARLVHLGRPRGADGRRPPAQS